MNYWDPEKRHFHEITDQDIKYAESDDSYYNKAEISSRGDVSSCFKETKNY